ncbi:EamA family transporter [Sulfuricella denitrificans]|uniref:EamA family transporter n=1 Tax=Sulfuricella denitrificans TaxID=649841 RepID=UPI001E44B094|nr:EamA family transporter [Sulfuricella denitrificans]
MVVLQWAGSSVTFLVLSALATGFSWLFYYRALQMAPASLVAPIDKLRVAFAIVLGVIFHGEVLLVKLVLGGAVDTCRGADSCLALRNRDVSLRGVVCQWICQWQ